MQGKGLQREAEAILAEVSADGRCNANAGIASAYVIRDGLEGDLRNLGLPDFIENAGTESI